MSYKNFEEKHLAVLSKLEQFNNISESEKKKLLKKIWKLLNQNSNKKGRGVPRLQPGEKRAGESQYKPVINMEKKEESLIKQIPKSQIPKNIRRTLDILSIISGVGTAYGLGKKITPYLLK